MIDWEGLKAKYDNCWGDGHYEWIVAMTKDFTAILAQHEADQATIAALRQQGEQEGMVAVKAKWLVDNHDGVKDHACAECVPHSDMVIAGFRCYYHKALAMIAAKP